MATRRKKSIPLVFRSDPSRRNIILNFQHSPETEFEDYGHEFHRSARLLMRRFLSKPGFSDLEALPIVFLYRHSLELYLKAIIHYGDLFLANDGRPLDTKKIREIYSSHRLVPILPHVRTISRFMGWSWDFRRRGLRTFSDVQAIIREIDSVDPISQVFRYPTDKRKKGALPHHFEFSLNAFVETVDPLVVALDATVAGLRQACDDIAQSYQQIY